MEKPSINFFLMNLVLLFIGIGLISIVFDLQKFAFVFELGILLMFIFIFVFAMYTIFNNKKWGWTIAGSALVLLLVNVFFIIIFTNKFNTEHMTTIFFAVVGLAIALANLIGSSHESDTLELEGEYEKMQNYYPYIDKMEPKDEKEIKQEEQSIEKKFTPGKFVASKKANKFHSPKCDWAKRISKVNQVWFNSQEEAKAQGFEADRCV